MEHHRLRILYIDETTGFGGGMVALRNLIAGLDPARCTAAVALRAENRTVQQYLRGNLPSQVRLYPIRRLSLPFLAPTLGANSHRMLGERVHALINRAKWGINVLSDTLPSALQMASIARHLRADAIHTNEQLITNMAGILAAWLAGIPCFCHNRMWGLSPALAGRLVPLVTHCFAISEFIKQDMVAHGVPASMISVVYDGLDLDRFSANDPPEAVRKDLGIAPDRCLAGIFGRMVEWKGHEFFLNALAQAAQEAPNLFGLIVGDTSPPNGPLMKRLRRCASRLGIAERVLFTGYRTDVGRLMAATDFVVVPSVEPEPLGLVSMEANAVSRPVIATRVGGIPEVVRDGENGLLIAVGDVEGFAKAMLRLRSDRELSQRLGRQGRRVVEEHFTNKRYAEGVCREYARILEVRNR